jgi:hypothetical protein
MIKRYVNIFCVRKEQKREREIKQLISIVICHIYIMCVCKVCRFGAFRDGGSLSYKAAVFGAKLAGSSNQME